MMKRTLAKGAAAVFAALTLNSTLYTVDQTQQAVVTRFGQQVNVVLNPTETDPKLRAAKISKVKQDIDTYAKGQGITPPSVDDSGAGLKFKIPYIDTVHYMDRRLLEWDGFPEEIPTKDKKYLYVDTTARIYIENPVIYMSSVGGFEERANGKLDDIIDSVVRENVSNRNAVELIRSTNRAMSVNDKELEETTKVDHIYEGRESIVKGITRDVDTQVERYGMRVADVQIKRLVWVPEVKKSVEDRMIAERARIEQKYLSEGQGEYQKIMGKKQRELDRISSEAYREAENLKGQADAKATKIYADAYGKDPEFYQYLGSLKVLGEHAKGTTLVVDKNNELFKYLTPRR